MSVTCAKCLLPVSRDVASKVKYAYGVGSGEEAIEALEKMLC